MSQKNEWKNDLISFISHECYYGDFKVLQADIYRNTREFQASRPSKEEPNRFEKKQPISIYLSNAFRREDLK